MKLKIALTEKHGMAMEKSNFPPPGVQYEFIHPVQFGHKIFRSPIKGYLSKFETKNHHLIEAILSPIRTKNIWIYSIANFHEAVAFNFAGIPLPRRMRLWILTEFIIKQNCKKIIFWSKAGANTLKEYPKVPKKIKKIITVVYPGIRQVSDCKLSLKKKRDSINLLFAGDFFRKGGANVIDAFEDIQKIYPKTKLFLCCDEKIDFSNSSYNLRLEYLKKIKSNRQIMWLGRVPRTEFLNKILPQTDIYLLPTYYEAFGFAILEAMSYGISVISTNVSAIPEMIQDGISGYLINVSKYNLEKLFKGYTVMNIPHDFKKYLTNQLKNKILDLIKNKEKRHYFGENALKTTKTKFSFDTHNKKMQKVYKELIL